MKKYIDLHLHSNHSKLNGDVIVWNDALATLIELRNKNIKGFAMTDHDIFNYRLFCELRQTIKDYCLDIVIFPGVEITIKRKNGVKGHILFIFDNECSNEQLLQLQEIIYNNKAAYGTNLDNLIEELKRLSLDYIMIPHIGKCDYVIYEDIKDYLNLIHYVESPSNKGELNNFKKNLTKPIINLMFSDTHKWNEYKGSSVYLDSEIINFTNLKQFLKWEE